MYKRIYKNSESLEAHGFKPSFILQRSGVFLAPYLAHLRMQMDVRLVRTFADCFHAILAHRNKGKGLILSELGGYITGFLFAPSGTKRLSNLFRSPKWSAQDIEDVHLEGAKKQVAAWVEADRRVLGFIDDSSVEKPESWHAEGLCAVYSSKAQRLTRIKKGYYHPPVKRICVPGFQWTALMIGGLSLIPMLGLMKWWTKKGREADSQDNVFYKLLKQIKLVFGSTLTLVLDRGFANEPTLERLFKCQQSFIIRWKSANLLQISPEKGVKSKNTWKVCQYQKDRDTKVFWDKERKQALRIGIVYEKVWHPEHLDKPMTLIVARQKNRQGGQPMYLLTDVEVDSIGIAWEILKSYIQRWDIEQAFRFNKAELGIQSIRIQNFQNRLKMMALVTLIYQFLLQLWRNWQAPTQIIIRKWCPRTDKRLENNRLPLYRLRIAIFNILAIMVAVNAMPN
jgi:hypothetical protein